MALALTFSELLSDDGKSMTITDLTGAYSVYNVGGWGSPNTTIGDILTATLVVAKMNSDNTFTNSPNVINLYPTLPSSVNGTEVVTAQQAGYGVNASFADGVYKLTYNVAGEGITTVHSATIYVGLISGICCCYKKAANAAAICLCDCGALETNLNNIARILRLYESSEDCGNLNQMQLYINKLTKLCAKCGCGC